MLSVANIFCVCVCVCVCVVMGVINVCACELLVGVLMCAVWDGVTTNLELFEVKFLAAILKRTGAHEGTRSNKSDIEYVRHTVHDMFK